MDVDPVLAKQTGSEALYLERRKIFKNCIHTFWFQTFNSTWKTRLDPDLHSFNTDQDPRRIGVHLINFMRNSGY